MKTFIYILGLILVGPLLLGAGLLLLLGSAYVASTPIVIPFLVVGAMIVLGISELRKERKKKWQTEQ